MSSDTKDEEKVAKDKGKSHYDIYGVEKKGLQILFSTTKAGPGRKVEQEWGKLLKTMYEPLFSSMHNDEAPKKADKSKGGLIFIF